MKNGHVNEILSESHAFTKSRTVFSHNPTSYVLYLFNNSWYVNVFFFFWMTQTNLKFRRFFFSFLSNVKDFSSATPLCYVNFLSSKMPWNGSNVYRVVGRLILLIFIYLEVQLYNEIRSKRYATFIILLASWIVGFGTKVVFYKSLHDVAASILS